MAHFNFVISQSAKWGHAGFYIDCHRMTVPENILLQKKALRLLPSTSRRTKLVTLTLLPSGTEVTSYFISFISHLQRQAGRRIERRFSGIRFTKYITTILRLCYDNAKVTIDLRRTSNLQNILRRAQGFS